MPSSGTKSLLTAAGWAVGIACVVVAVGLFMSDVPVPKPISPYVKVGVAGGAAPDHAGVQALASDLEAELAKENDPHLLALKGRLAQNPNDTEALLDIGFLYVKEKQYAKARGYYLRASQTAPKNLEARTHLGTVAYFLGDVDEALHHYDQVLALDPNYTVALFEMGAVLRFGKDDLQGAVDTWERFLELDPEAREAENIRNLVDQTKAQITEQGSGHPVAPAHPGAESDTGDDENSAPWPVEAAS